MYKRQDDAPLREAGRDLWLLDAVRDRFMLLCYVDTLAAVDATTLAALAPLGAAPVAVEVVLVAARGGVAPGGLRVLEDSAGRYAERYDARNGTAYLVRPDQHVSARWRTIDSERVLAALARAIGRV